MRDKLSEVERIPVVDLRVVAILGPCLCPHVSGCAPAYHAVWCPHGAVVLGKAIVNGS